MPDITIAGATFRNVPQIDIPKDGGGTASFIYEDGSKSITENGTHDVSGFAEAVVNVSGGGGGSLKPYVIRPDAELLDSFVYNGLIVADEGISLPAYSTTATKFKTISYTLHSSGTQSEYDFLLLYYSLAVPIYDSSYDTSQRSTQLLHESNGYVEYYQMLLSDFVPTRSELVTLRPSLGLSYLAYRSTATAYSFVNGTYGFYINVATPNGFSSSMSRTIDLYFRGSATYMSQEAYEAVTDARYQCRLELYRAPKTDVNGGGWLMNQGYQRIADAYKNSTPL